MIFQKNVQLLTMMWPYAGIGIHRTIDGGEVSVIKPGELDDKGAFSRAEIMIDGTIYYGEIAPCGDVSEYEGNPDHVILQIVPRHSRLILRTDGTPVPQVIVDINAVYETAYETLLEGCSNNGCSVHLLQMESHERVGIFTRLMVERLQRKCGDIKDIYHRCEDNWNETMYVMLLRTMGDSRNKDAFTELAEKVSYSNVSRERNNIQCVESLLLGASGLLEMYDDDVYIRELKRDFEYLRNKYSIVPMMAGTWQINRNNPNNHPVIRIAQLAAFLTTKEFLFENMMLCRTVNDLQLFFRAEASQYWSTHYIPGRRSIELPKRIGSTKANLLGINLASPMMFAYGDYVGDENLKEISINLLEKIVCEDNRIVNGWRDKGVILENACDSQAVIQLFNEYCIKELCWKCQVGKRTIKKLWKENKSVGIE